MANMIPDVTVRKPVMNQMLDTLGEAWHTTDEVRRWLYPALDVAEIDRLLTLLTTQPAVSVRVTGVMITIRVDTTPAPDGYRPLRTWIATTEAYVRWHKAYAAYLADLTPPYARFSSELLERGHEVLVERDPDHGLLAVGWGQRGGDMVPVPRTDKPFVAQVLSNTLAPADDPDRSCWFDTDHGTVYVDGGSMVVALHVRLDRPPHAQRGEHA